ncbi:MULTISPECIES: GlxA family transcriptional regulator [unclassified Nocardioides]|uniref:GlxA family transcriptional regulator n=1 Tax=unclassified Nocardioides TaxID=2615069 RepID=UPI0006F24224|nr:MULTISPECIES: helix-turn-helix domain-containing protein [unclassified Nocardioides]KQY56789.1 AraC family transcriptional regulator [Nocardioides sp. Root140]KQZ67015.1 AraC family transcriptional regulator [Nocardioides sp. Root151]KRF12909.1 AraC family transcriptional regulator [Nocardioides sp. Soil796]
MRIAVHAFEGITMFHLAAPLLVFGEVTRAGLADDWTTTVWTEDGTAIRTAEGILIDDVAGPSAIDADLLVFPSWPTDLPPADEHLTDRIRAAHRHGARVAGLCLGAFPVAESGILDGRGASTHWSAAAKLARRFPAIEVNASALYLDHGDVLTSAGTASAIDACLHIVRTHLGSTAAATVARHLVVAPHREGGQAQYVERPIPEPGGVGHLSPTLDWALAHLDQDLTVDTLAAHARMSRRNFTRRFSEVTGTTPATWVLARRLDESRRLLESTTWPIDRIARTSGFRSVVTFRQNFTAAYSTTPTSYRQRFADPLGPTKEVLT